MVHAGTAHRLADQIAFALSMWLHLEHRAHAFVAGPPVRLITAVGYWPGCRPNVIASLIGSQMPRIGPVLFVVPPYPPMAFHRCRRVSARTIVDRIPVSLVMNDEVVVSVAIT